MVEKKSEDPGGETRVPWDERLGKLEGKNRSLIKKSEKMETEKEGKIRGVPKEDTNRNRVRIWKKKTENKGEIGSLVIQGDLVGFTISNLQKKVS